MDYVAKIIENTLKKFILGSSFNQKGKKNILDYIIQFPQRIDINCIPYKKTIDEIRNFLFY